MPIKAADYSVGFDTQAAKASMVELEKAVQDGSVDMKSAVDQVAASFNQVTNVHRTGKKEVDAFTQLIRDEKQETRTLGFLMRNTSESVSALSATFGGPNGLGKVVGSAYSRFDQLNFALEGMAVVGEKAGGSFSKIAGVLGGIAVPAGIALAAFSFIKEEIDKDEEQIKSLQERIRSLNVDLGRIQTNRLAELNRELAQLAVKKPELQYWTAVKMAIDGQLGTSYALRDIERQRLEIEAKILTVVKAQREERERLRALEMQIVNDSQAEWQALYLLKTAQLAYEQSNQTAAVEGMRKQSALLKDQLRTGNDYLLQMIARGASLKETLGMELSLMQILKQRKDLEYQIGNAVADNETRRSPEYQASLAFLRDAQKEYKALRSMEDRNAPKRIISHITVGEGVTGAQDTLKQLNAEYNAFAVQGGDILAQSLTSGFSRGFSSGKLLLSDFTSSMLQSILQIAAQESAISIVSGLLSFLGAGPFGVIAGMLGSNFFKGGSGGGMGSNNKGSGFDIKGKTVSPIAPGSSAGATIGDLHSVMRQVVTETQMVRNQIRQSRPAVFVGGVTTPDAIVTENIGVAERRRARRLK